MLKASGIKYAIGKKILLNNINADFLPGEFNIILGPNGSGKSSFLKIFSGETNAYEGEVLYEGKNIKSISKEVMATQRAVMSQQPELSFPLSVAEVVMMGRYPHFNFNPNAKDIRICDEAMEVLNLHSFKERNYLTLSGGEKQRVHFARVLAQVWEQPQNGFRYFFLDEPLASLDINYQQEFLQIVQSFLNDQTVVVAVLHDINLAIQFGHQLFFLKEGQVAAAGKPAEIITESLIAEVFAVRSSIVKNPLTGVPLVVYG